MSSFCGIVDEIPGISVDCFDGRNLNSSAYFLSHCHRDHMKGLNLYFLKQLDNRDVYIYCSPISKIILETEYGEHRCIMDIDINDKRLIQYRHEGRDRDVFVTCITAGHCPGSVMFLFEKMNSELILYTGDFRMNRLDYKRIVPLHSDNGANRSKREIAVVYLDTTFLNPDFASFPLRTESMRAVCDAAKEWLDQNPRHFVSLECSAWYGSEFLFMELSKYVNMRIHVKEFAYESYCRIPEVARHVTDDPLATRVHACKAKKGWSCLGRRVWQSDILTIVPSAYYWGGKDTSVVKEWKTSNRLNVCYSTHASYKDLKAFLEYFKPREIYLCVVPMVAQTNGEQPRNVFQNKDVRKTFQERYTLDDMMLLIKREENGRFATTCEAVDDNEGNREKYMQISDDDHDDDDDDDDATEPWAKYYFSNRSDNNS